MIHRRFPLSPWIKLFPRPAANIDSIDLRTCEIHSDFTTNRIALIMRPLNHNQISLMQRIISSSEATVVVSCARSTRVALNEITTWQMRTFAFLCFACVCACECVECTPNDHINLKTVFKQLNWHSSLAKWSLVSSIAVLFFCVSKNENRTREINVSRPRRRSKTEKKTCQNIQTGLTWWKKLCDCRAKEPNEGKRNESTKNDCVYCGRIENRSKPWKVISARLVFIVMSKFFFCRFISCSLSLSRFPFCILRLRLANAAVILLIIDSISMHFTFVCPTRFLLIDSKTCPPSTNGH